VISSPHRPTYVEVDLGVVRANVAALALYARQSAPASMHIGAVVKADAYGHGANEVAPAALQAGAEVFFVATLDEALSLRATLADHPIVMLSEPEPQFLVDALRAGITPTISTVPTLATLCDTITSMSWSDRRSLWPSCHLEVETGLHRMGSDRGTLTTLAKMAAAGGVTVRGVYSHFARADEGDRGSESVAEQVLRLQEAYDRVVESLGYRPLLHIANTAGLVHYPHTAFDLVRLGIGMYGYGEPSLSLRPALRLVSRVVRLHELEESSGVSYGHRRVFPAGTQIATIPIGYADGVRRSLFEVGGQVLIRGRRHVLAGTVAMDYVMVVVDDPEVVVGDEVVLIGAQGDELLGADEVAARLSTISYEILTSISDRVPRRYRG